MTLLVRIEVPQNNGPYEARVQIGTAEYILAPGDYAEGYVHSGSEVHVSEVPQGTKAEKIQGATPGTFDAMQMNEAGGFVRTAPNDFPLGEACDLSGEGACEACQ